MAFRLPLRRATASLARGQRAVSLGRRWESSQAASGVAEDVRLNPSGQTRLSHPDPAPDSTSARLVQDFSPYMVATYARPGPVFVRGEGTYLWDVEDRKYLDFTAGIAVNGLGHCDPQVAEIIADQSKTLMHASNLYYNPWTGALSKLLVKTTVASGAMHDASAVFVCNSGSEANEAAIKFARKHARVLDPSGSKFEIVSFRGAFHGRTMGSLSATPTPKYQAPFAPMVPGFRVGEYNDVSGIPTLVTPQTAAVLVEPIQGEGGVHSATPEFLAALAARCREVGALLVYDEIQCGLARTGGLWAHGGLPASSHPDVLTTAKALGNGFPIGAVVVNRRVADAVKIGDHGTTFGGNPLASRVAHHVLGRLADPALQEGVRARGGLLRDGLENRIRARWPGLVPEPVRGRGLILGLQLDRDPAPVVDAARHRGLLVITAGKNTLRFVPSLLVSDAEIEQGLDVLEESIESVMRA